MRKEKIRRKNFYERRLRPQNVYPIRGHPIPLRKIRTKQPILYTIIYTISVYFTLKNVSRFAYIILIL
nr:MAG TPA: hypothetical protein [Caudoviricetes sp.]